MQPLFPLDAMVTRKRLRSATEYDARTEAFRNLASTLHQFSSSSESSKKETIVAEGKEGSAPLKITAPEQRTSANRDNQQWTKLQLVWGDSVSQWSSTISRRSVLSQRCQQMQVIVELFTAETQNAAGSHASSRKPMVPKSVAAQPHGAAPAVNRVPPQPHVLGRLACHVALGKYDGPFGAVSFYDDLVDVYVLQSCGLLGTTHGNQPVRAQQQAAAATAPSSVHTPTWTEVHRLVRRHIGEMPVLYSQSANDVPVGDERAAVESPTTRERCALSRIQHARRCVASLCLMHIEGLVHRSLCARGGGAAAGAIGVDGLGALRAAWTSESMCAVLDAAVQQAVPPLAGGTNASSKGMHRVGLPNLSWSELKRRVSSGTFYTSLAQFARDLDLYAISVLLARMTPSHSVVDVDAEAEFHKRASTVAAAAARTRQPHENHLVHVRLPFVFAGVREALRGGLVDRVCCCFEAEYKFTDISVPCDAVRCSSTEDHRGPELILMAVPTFPGSREPWSHGGGATNDHPTLEGVGHSPAARALRVLSDLRSMDARGALYSPLWRLEVEGANTAVRKGGREEDPNLWKLPLSSLYCIELAILGALSSECNEDRGFNGAEDEKRKARGHFSDDASCFDWLTTQLEELVDECVQTLGPGHETTKLAGALRHDLVRRAKAHGLLA